MLKNKMSQKVLAGILVFTLTFANFAFTTEALATSIFDTWFAGDVTTGHENVEFDAYFEAEGDKSYSVISDVNAKKLAITLDLNVKDSGYLKDAKVAIEPKEEGEKLNFKIKGDFEETESVQNFENNVISLKQVDYDSEVVLNIPIEYQNEEYVNESKLIRDSKVVFSGMYVDNKGGETELSKEIDLNVFWKDDRTVKTTSEVTKYIKYGDGDKAGVILQTVVNVDSTVEGNSLPVKNSIVKIEAPTLNEIKPSSVQVLATSTAGTNGKEDEKVEFSTGNWGYDAETNVLTISVTNEKELVEVSEAGENDNIIDGEAEKVEERYYSKSGVDSYVITYTYEGLDKTEEISVNTKVNAELTTFSGVESAEYINKTTNEENYEFKLSGETGDIVSYNINNETESVSKAYTYVNYNSSDKYEVTYNSKATVNVSYSEIVEGIVLEDVDNYYVAEDGSNYVADDVYYKQISINKENMISLLGEDGSVTVKDLSGNEIVKFNKDYEANENGDCVFDFGSRISKVIFETSKAITEGNLIISKVMASSNSMYTKEQYKAFKELVSKTIGKAKYTYVEDLAVIGNTENTVALNNVTTKTTLVLDRDSLSTLATNDNVELRLELNNNTDKSDVYGHSIFEIKMPNYVTDVTVTDSNIMYGEGLEISNIEVYDVDGEKYIRVTVDGVQNAISSGVLNNGTNIVLNTNITVDLYAPATESQFVLKYTNDSATSYADGGVSILPIYYSAPTGLVAVNSTSNFDSIGSVLTSIRQGVKEAEIAKGDSEKIASMEIIVMNNNSNIVSNLSILGRIPFEGVKDIETGEDLGTTVNTTLVNGLVADSKNNAQFKVYYSENGEATKDLSDSSNGWKEEVENFDTIKSYLIVPVDENYEMQVAEVIRFTYEYKIPANLKLNESIYGTFLAYYKNHTDVATVDEKSQADKIGLSTGEGPELQIALSSDVENSVKEYEEMSYKVEVKNTGKTSAQNVVVTIPVDSSLVIKDALSEEGITTVAEQGKIEFIISTLGIDEVKELTFKLSARAGGENNDIKIMATAIADDLEEAVNSNSIEFKIEETVLKVKLAHNFTDENTTVNENQEVRYDISATNLSEKDLENGIMEFKLPDEVAYKEGYVVEASTTPVTGKNHSLVSYDDSTRTVTVNVGTIKSKTTAQAKITVVTKQLDAGSTYKVISAEVTTRADGIEPVSSNVIHLGVGKASLVFTQTTNTTETYVKEGKTIEYVFTVKNEGSFEAQDVSLIDYVPDGLLAKSITYGIGGRESTKRVSGANAPTITVSIPAGAELKATVKAIAKNLDGAAEATVTNKGSIQSKTMESPVLSNEITHIIEADPEYANQVVEDIVENTGATANSSSSSGSNITKTYKIVGYAWLDENKDGMRSENEQKMTDVTARLVNADTGTIVKSITTDSKGSYTFSGVANGNYLVIFDYDTVKYTVTTYQKAGVEANVNSDAITTKVEQDGRQRNAAVTDRIVVADSSVSNIDIGFVYADTFDLSLETSITKMTVQNKAGTDSVEFDHTTLAQMPIAAKHLSSSTTYIEYSIKVSNVGEIAGNAKKIVDYIPAGMTFSSTLNPDWYTGTDGNLYTTQLADVELKPGETREIKLVLTKQMTEENTGLVNNITEIAEDYNIYGVSDTNSTPMNKAQGENDMGVADAIITVKTGEVFIYISVIITSIILGSIVIFIAYNQIIVKRRKAGV